MKIKRLIFDVDNTLIANVSFEEAIKNTLIELGIYTDDNVKKCSNAIESYERKYSNYNIKDYKKHIEDSLNVSLDNNYIEVLFKYLKDVIPPYNEKLINTIKSLSKKYELVLLTNYFSISQLNRLNNMGIGKYFIEVYGEDLIKPNKESYIKACGKYKPEECVMIGDNLYLDIQCARNVGLNTIFVNTNNKNIDNLDTLIVNKVEDITEEMIEKIKRRK